MPNLSFISLIKKHIQKSADTKTNYSPEFLPKIDNAFAAIDAGVQEVLIGDAKDLLANTGAETTGTL